MFTVEISLKIESLTKNIIFDQKSNMVVKINFFSENIF